MGFCWLGIFPLLVEVTHGRCLGFWEILLDIFTYCEHGPRWEMAVFNSFDEGGGGWAKASLVEKVDRVGGCSSGHDTVDVFRRVVGAYDVFL
jgi:hypothetical protein